MDFISFSPYLIARQLLIGAQPLEMLSLLIIPHPRKRWSPAIGRRSAGGLTLVDRSLVGPARNPSGHTPTILLVLASKAGSERWLLIENNEEVKADGDESGIDEHTGFAEEQTLSEYHG